MTQPAPDRDPVDTAIDTHIDALIDTLTSVDDHAERWSKQEYVGVVVDERLREVRQGVARGLKRDRELTWREVGEICGGVTPQRAEQISRGV